MSRTRIIETEVSTAISAGLATSISNATVVRLHNDSGGIATVAVASSVGAATSAYFTMPIDYVEFLEKSSTDVIWTTPSIKATKVGYTG